MENKELIAKLLKICKENNSTDELAKALKDAGYDFTPAQVEGLLVKLQSMRANEIGKCKLDEDLLANVSGGQWMTNSTSDKCLSLYKKGNDCWIDAACAAAFEMPITSCDMSYECIYNNLYTPVSAAS